MSVSTAFKTNGYVLEKDWAPLTDHVIPRKLQYFGQTARHRDPEGIFMEESQGKRLRGRQKTRWMNGVTKTTGSTTVEALRLGEDRRDGKLVVATNPYPCATRSRRILQNISL